MMAQKDSPKEIHEEFRATVEKKAQRKLKAQKEGYRAIWYGLGTSGIVGWLVTIPTVLATFLGVWIDKRWSSPYSWTLMLMLIGIVFGCFSAWYWIEQQRQP